MDKDGVKLLIKNMVCQRCIAAVDSLLSSLTVPFTAVSMGKVDLTRKLTDEELKGVEQALNKIGFEIIEKRVNKIVADIKQAVIEYLSLGMDSQHLKLSFFITSKIPYDYSYLSDLFSSVEGKTIEQFFILQRIEKVKELLLYDQLSLTEISYQTGFSSVHHLSAQFKKVTGFTPTDFKKSGAGIRKSLDRV